IIIDVNIDIASCEVRSDEENIVESFVHGDEKLDSSPAPADARMVCGRHGKALFRVFSCHPVSRILRLGGVRKRQIYAKQTNCRQAECVRNPRRHFFVAPHWFSADFDHWSSADFTAASAIVFSFVTFSLDTASSLPMETTGKACSKAEGR